MKKGNELDIQLQEMVLKTIEDKIYSTPEDLAQELAVPLETLMPLLGELEQEYRIAKTKHGKYALASTLGLFRGELDCKQGGFAFLRTPDWMDDIFVPASKKNGAMNGEDVLVKLAKHQEAGKSMEGAVVKIFSQLPITTVGTVDKKNNTVFVVSDDRNVDDIYIPKEKAKGLKTGQKVVVDITRRAGHGKSAEGKVSEVLGRAGEKGVDILAYARRFGLVAEFDAACKKQAQELTKEKKKIDGRLDLRDRLIFTIDGKDAKDLDDAVSLRMLENGNYELGVHIADVSHYVRESTPLDKEALKRGTSVYMVDRVVPMLPKELSNDLCSLNAGEDKLTLSCIMEIDSKGKTVSQMIENTVIRSSHRLTYDGVNRILRGDTDEAEKYAEIVETLKQMNTLAKQLRARRFEKGSIDFNIDEADIILNEQGVPVDVRVRERGEAEKLIEEFMLRANITVAEQYYYMELPFLYRIHEQPDADRMKELAVFLGNFGIKLKGFQDIHPHAIEEVLEKVEGTDEAAIVNRVTLRALKKAKYATEPVSHFGLAADRYCHFTSPIRRYPDLQVHRIIKTVLDGRMDDAYIRHLSNVLPEVAAQTSARERNAIEAERAVQDLKMTEYMAQFVGKEFPAVVSGVTRFGIFAELENTIEGMIPLGSLKEDYYVYYEKEYCVIGERTKKRITLGDKVMIRVVSADVSAAKIEFTFA
ncbi:MAG: ribonuclease R [Christensenella sp.]|uniref:ribonuclease R n=1 Tax=Christensenella sp. TaxID=1935934 RepID=UPI002B1F98F0|nr:ribonuclease R [Christensenella sp.]MEA5003809.1 ribonuclease R [Christensenella sp.]